jgi:NADH-quinone oxidoreductase subunit A
VVGLAWVWAHGDLEWVKNLTGASHQAPTSGSANDRRAA